MIQIEISYDHLLFFLGMVLLFLIMFRTWKNLQRLPENTNKENTSSVQTKNFPIKYLEFIAAHETGHLMLYAILPEIPSGLYVQIVEEGKGSVVQSNLSWISTANVSEWYMLLNLAGKAGEIFLLEDVSTGSNIDYKVWEEHAENYLINHMDGMYFFSPKNNQEQEWNAKKLEILESNQAIVLKKYFEENRTVFEDLYHLLLERKKLTMNEIEPYFKKIKPVNGLPKLTKEVIHESLQNAE